MPLFSRRDVDTSAFKMEEVSDDYFGRMGYIGRLLDESASRSVVIVEISGSYVLRAIDKASGKAYMSEVVPDDFAHGHPKSPSAAQPSSYEALLRVIGQDMDRRIAANVAVIERASSFEVVGWQRGEAAGHVSYVEYVQRYDRTDLQAMAERMR